MFRTIYIPVGVPTFDQNAAGDMLKRSAALLGSLDPEIDVPDGLLLGADKVSAFTDGKTVDLAVIQNGVNETLALAGKFGIAPRDFAEAVSYGGAQNFYLDSQWQNLEADNWTTAFSLANGRES